MPPKPGKESPLVDSVKLKYDRIDHGLFTGRLYLHGDDIGSLSIDARYAHDVSELLNRLRIDKSDLPPNRPNASTQKKATAVVKQFPKFKPFKKRR